MKIPDELINCRAETAIVLGSGLGRFAENLPQTFSVDYGAINGLPVSGVPGHAGRFVVASLAGQPLLIAQGRVHLYEGWSAQDVVKNISLMHAIGIRKILLTNAAGTLNSSYLPGSWMMLSDHINLLGASPLSGGPCRPTASHRARQSPSL